MRARLLAARLAEGAALGVGCAAGVVAVLAGLLLLRGETLGKVSLLILAAGACAGATHGLLRRPALLAAAGEADRQLDLHDLLLTAISIDPESQDAWHGAVLAMARSKLSGFSPSDVVARRWGARAWAGVGLAVLLAAGVQVLGPGATRAGTTPTRDNLKTTTADEHSSTAGSAPPTWIPSARPVAESSNSADTTNSIDDSSESSQNDSTRRSNDGGGEGLAETEGFKSQPQESSNAPDALENTLPSTDDLTNSRITGGQRNAVPAPAPWASPTWAEARRDAGTQLDAGNIPDAYRLIVLAYFERTP